MKNAMQTDVVSQPTHSFFHSSSEGLTHSRTHVGYIAPRTLAKMRDENYLKLARQRFLSDLPFSTPSEAVEAGARSVTDWCLCLADAKSEFGRGDYPNN